MIEIAGDVKNKNIYCPWDNFSVFASKLYALGAEVSIEILHSSAFPWLVNIFNETNVRVSIGNPIEEPGFVSAGGLTKFDLSIAFPPLGEKYNFKDGDWYNRFPEKTGSGAVLNVRHVLAQTIGKVIIAVKANTGKVAIVCDAADLAKDIPWIANQSCLIVRCKDKIDPKVLSSEMGQYLLRSISSGATIPLIQLARLKELQIVIPPREEAEQIIRDFDRLVELQSQIETVKQQQKTLSSSHWSL
jgi:hypothetical protein